MATSCSQTGQKGAAQMVGRAVGGFEGAAAAPSDRNPVGLVLAKACVQTSAVRSRAGAIGCPLLDEHQAQSGTHRGERECAGGSARAPWGMRGKIRPVAGRRGWCRSWSASRSTAAAWAHYCPFASCDAVEYRPREPASHMPTPPEPSHVLAPDLVHMGALEA